MRLPSTTPPSTTSESAGPEDPSLLRQRSLALRSALAGLGGDGRRPTVLDLGPARNESIRFFTVRGCVYFVEDLLRNGLPAIAGRPLDLDTPRPDSVFDLVLAWDLLNHLRPEEIEGLARRLAPHCRSGTGLLAVIFTHHRMPTAPLGFRIADGEHVVHAPIEPPFRQAPDYHEPELLRALPGFRVASSLLLRNGMQEYLFAWGDEGREAAADPETG